jgi:hypothetical protein
MSEIDIDGALDALSAELPADEADIPEAVDLIGDDNPETESFTKFDPSTLPDDLQSVYRSMQGDYTRKTQEIAELRRSFESFSETGVDPKDALEAAQFFSRLDSDPYAAAEFVQNMSSRLEQLGIGQQAKEDSAPDDVSYEGLSPEVAAELQEMRAFREQMVAEQQRATVMAELETTEQQIRLANPHYTDDDVDAIYSLAYATDGDLVAAADQYHAIQQRLLGSYLQSKQVPQGATPTSSGPSSVPSREYTSLDDAHKAAMEAVRNIS